MQDDKKGDERRIDERLDLSLEIALPSSNGKTINVSASGVFFEVTTDDIDSFSPGKTIPIEISTTTKISDLSERKIKLKGNGTIIRSKELGVTDHGIKLAVALKFKKSLDTVINVF
ncbi:MAG: hypothetical protein SCARUB_02714 [Candidatus Scalindua rubra]|uniref:PilZ domain protein n=1 Tax=Candidatus Scalindua rubra TaxID=1872076 RepID=A0A1E3X952_9BACT|nr:MAG: hypothetical protein SCARUB_02714 [Candidatus Scalindua rubra]